MFHYIYYWKSIGWQVFGYCSFFPNKSSASRTIFSRKWRHAIEFSTQTSDIVKMYCFLVTQWIWDGPIRRRGVFCHQCRLDIRQSLFLWSASRKRLFHLASTPISGWCFVVTSHAQFDVIGQPHVTRYSRKLICSATLLSNSINDGPFSQLKVYM